MKFKIHDIVRYGHGSTALMRITTFSNNRAYGTQMMSGSYGAQIKDLTPATKEEKKAFIKEQFKKLDSWKTAITLDMKKEMKRFGEWAEVTFPKSTELSVLKHMQEEFGELIEAVTPENKGEEAADLFLLLTHYCHKNNINLSYEVERKFLINIDREWETEMNDKGYFNHIDN